MDEENNALLNNAIEAARKLRGDDLLEAIAGMARPEFAVKVNQIVEDYKSSSKAFRDDLMAQGSVFKPNLLDSDSTWSKLTKAVDRELAAVTRDGRRYRWLRSRDVETIYSGGIFVGKSPENLVLADIQLDAAIDAAMAAEQPEDADPSAGE